MQEVDKIQVDDDIQEEIADDVDDLQQQQIALAGGRPSKPGDPLTSSDNIGASGISSSGANAIDHSIDTLQLDQYDYVEEVQMK